MKEPKIKLYYGSLLCLLTVLGSICFDCTFLRLFSFLFGVSVYAHGYKLVQNFKVDYQNRIKLLLLEYILSKAIVIDGLVYRYL